MSTTNTLGIGRLLPVTATFTLPLAILHTSLCYNVIKWRIAGKVLLGKDATLARDTESYEAAKARRGTDDSWLADPLLVATTMHSNFTENAPFALLFAAAVELNGGNRRVLAGVLGTFVAVRVAHAWGTAAGLKGLRFRQLGFFGTLGVLLGLGGWGAWLAREFWGF